MTHEKQINQGEHQTQHFLTSNSLNVTPAHTSQMDTQLSTPKWMVDTDRKPRSPEELRFQRMNWDHACKRHARPTVQDCGHIQRYLSGNNTIRNVELFINQISGNNVDKSIRLGHLDFHSSNKILCKNCYLNLLPYLSIIFKKMVDKIVTSYKNIKSTSNENLQIFNQQTRKFFHRKEFLLFIELLWDMQNFPWLMEFIFNNFTCYSYYLDLWLILLHFIFESDYFIQHYQASKMLLNTNTIANFAIDCMSVSFLFWRKEHLYYVCNIDSKYTRKWRKKKNSNINGNVNVNRSGLSLISLLKNIFSRCDRLTRMPFECNRLSLANDIASIIQQLEFFSTRSVSVSELQIQTSSLYEKLVSQILEFMRCDNDQMKLKDTKYLFINAPVFQNVPMQVICPQFHLDKLIKHLYGILNWQETGLKQYIRCRRIRSDNMKQNIQCCAPKCYNTKYKKQIENTLQDPDKNPMIKNKNGKSVKGVAWRHIAQKNVRKHIGICTTTESIVSY